MKFLSINFTLEELIYSGTAKSRGLDNTPGQREIENLEKLATKILQPIRDKYGKSIKVTSGYRSPSVNSAIGGVKTSQHLGGEAADIFVGEDNAKLFRLIQSMIKNGEITVGQLIWEGGTKTQPRWIHISLPTSRLKNQILYIYGKN